METTLTVIEVQGHAQEVFEVYTDNTREQTLGYVYTEEAARLIAAAPDLLEACKWLYSQWVAYADQRYLTADEKEHKKQAEAALQLAEWEE